MPQGHLEHANLTVSDPDRSAALLKQLCGWHERWHGVSPLGGRTVHVGNERDYISLYSHDDGPRHYAKGAPLNHVGFVVDDLAAAEAIVIEVGLKPFGHDDYEPGKRFYFFDWDGIEFELISYN